MSPVLFGLLCAVPFLAVIFGLWESKKQTKRLLDKAETRIRDDAATHAAQGAQQINFLAARIDALSGQIRGVSFRQMERDITASILGINALKERQAVE